MISIRVQRGDAHVKDLDVDGEVTIGRVDSAGLTLDDAQVSRLHAVIQCSPQGCSVIDRGSMNGTYLDDVRLEKDVAVRWSPGQVMRIRDFRLTYKGAATPETSVEIMGDETFHTQIAADPLDEMLRSNLLDGLGATEPWTSGERELLIAAVRPETHDVTTFRLVSPGGEAFNFLPGQFVQLKLEINGMPLRRSYSVSSSPSRPMTLDLTVKRIPGGVVSNWMPNNLQAGHRVRVHPPAGKFSVFLHPAPKVLFLAAGSGVTPLMSMLRWIHDVAAPIDVAVVYSVRTEKDIIFRRELEQIAAVNPNVCVSVTLTGDRGGWLGVAGRVDGERLRSIVPDLSEREVFMCGPRAFSMAMGSELDSLGVDRRRIHQESFGGPRKKAAAPAETDAPAPRAKPAAAPARGPDPTDIKIPVKIPVKVDPPPAPPAREAPAAPAAPPSAPATPPDAQASAAGFKATFRKSGASFTVDPELTLLEAAEENGLDLNSGCREGGCGACEQKLLSGDVHMDKHDLSPDEIAAGAVYLCTAHPRSDVEIDA